MGEIDGVRDARCKSEGELEQTNAESKKRYHGLVEFGVDSGLERVCIYKVHFKVRWGWHLRLSILTLSSRGILTIVGIRCVHTR